MAISLSEACSSLDESTRDPGISLIFLILFLVFVVFDGAVSTFGIYKAVLQSTRDEDSTNPILSIRPL